jgi:hypothetical protein
MPTQAKRDAALADIAQRRADRLAATEAKRAARDARPVIIGAPELPPEPEPDPDPPPP